VADDTQTPTAEALAKGILLATDVHHVVVVPALQEIRLVSVSKCFAPGASVFDGGDLSSPAPGDTCTIRYAISDPSGFLTEGRIEISRKKTGAPVAILPLDPDGLQHGAHTFEWDGLCTEGDAAGKPVDVLHSPYAVRVVAKGPKGEIEDKGMETSVLLADLAIARGRYFPSSNPPAPKSDAAYQYRLTTLGFHPGQIDGVVGTKTRRAIKNFQRASPGLKATGSLDAYTKAYLDEENPPGTGVDLYQYILNRIGYRCGAIDGLAGAKTKRAVRRYRDDRGLSPGDDLDDEVRSSLDGETIAPLDRREILEGDLAGETPDENPLPPAGDERKVFVDGDSSFSPGGLPYHQKYSTEHENLIRPHFPVVVRPLVQRKNGKTTFAPGTAGALRIDFTVGVAPPPPSLGIPNAKTRAFVKGVMSKDGGETSTGYHAHQKRGGVRTSSEPGVFLTAKKYDPYDVQVDGNKHWCACIEDTESEAFGTAGVYFVPSHIAGDRFVVTATANVDAFDTPPPGVIAARTGTVIVWRRYRVAKLWLMTYVPRPHRTETAPQLGLPPWYKPAFITFVEPEASPSPLMVQPRGADPKEVDLALYTAILREAGYRSTTLPDAQIQQHFNANILWPLRPAATYSAADEQGYYDAISDEIDAFEERFSKMVRELSLLEASEGLVVLVFDKNAPKAGTFGIHAIKNNKLQKWAWSVLASQACVLLIHDQDTDASAVKNGAVNGETLAHETGHSLWLHHASTEAGHNPAAADQPEHNKPEWQTCTMSYVSLANFCGRCILKLRGWDEQKL
jgi:hypothetical protein